MALKDLWKLVHRKYQVRLFEYPSSAPRTPGPDPAPGYEAKLFRTLAEVPQEVAAIAMPGRFFDLMRWRMRRGRAWLLVVYDPKGAVASYCWIQSWRPYARGFVNIPRNGRMVGFGWVHPDHRRVGLFTFMCRRSVMYVDPSERPYGYAILGNEATPRACIKADYIYLGEFRIRRIFWLLQLSTRLEHRAASWDHSDVTAMRPTAAAPAPNAPPRAAVAAREPASSVHAEAR